MIIEMRAYVTTSIEAIVPNTLHYLHLYIPKVSEVQSLNTQGITMSLGPA